MSCCSASDDKTKLWLQTMVKSQMIPKWGFLNYRDTFGNRTNIGYWGIHFHNENIIIITQWDTHMHLTSIFSIVCQQTEQCSETLSSIFTSYRTMTQLVIKYLPIAPGWYMGLFFMHTWLPQTMSAATADGRCLRDFARCFSHNRFRCPNGKTPLK